MKLFNLFASAVLSIPLSLLAQDVCGDLATRLSSFGPDQQLSFEKIELYSTPADCNHWNFACRYGKLLYGRVTWCDGSSSNSPPFAKPGVVGIGDKTFCKWEMAIHHGADVVPLSASDDDLAQILNKGYFVLSVGSEEVLKWNPSIENWDICACQLKGEGLAPIYVLESQGKSLARQVSSGAKAQDQLKAYIEYDRDYHFECLSMTGR